MFKVFFNRNRSFFDFVYKEVERKNIRESTRTCLLAQIKRIEKEGVFKRFKDINTDNVVLFNKKIKECGYKLAYISILNQTIHHFVKLAIKKGFINENPYDTMKFKKAKSTEKKYLTAEMLKKLESTTFQGAKQYIADVFIFCAHTGISFADVFSLKKNQIIKEKGRKWIIGNRQKTDEPFTIPLDTKAEEVIKKYVRNNEFIFKKISISFYNRYLHLIGNDIGVDISLSSHKARHTFATLLAESGVTMDVIAKMMGHSSINNTSIYAQITTDRIDRELTACAVY